VPVEQVLARYRCYGRVFCDARVGIVSAVCEFCSLTLSNLPNLIVPFKRPVYERVVKEFSRLAGN